MSLGKADKLRQLLLTARLLRQAAEDDQTGAVLFRTTADALEDTARRRAAQHGWSDYGARSKPCNIVC